MRVSHTLEPIYDEFSKILILGSMPSIKSRENMMYYSHPQNRFWKILSILFNEDIKDRREFVLRKHIALWDVIESCDINGSSDSSIKNVISNDISIILKKASIKEIFVLGKKAYELYMKYIYDVIKKRPILLSSTSPANASKTLEDLVNEYKILLTYLKS